LEITLQEYSKWQDNIIKRLLEDREYKDVVETAKRNNQQYIKRFLSERKVNGVELNPKDNEELFYQFLATRYDGKENDLHLLKTKLITLITPYDQEAFAVHKGNVKFWQNSLDLGNDYSFPKLFSDLLTKRAIHFRNNVIAERGIKLKTPNNNVIELKKNSRQNLEISFHTPDGKIYTYEANDLLHDNLGMSKRFLSYLIGENSVFTSSNFDFKKKVYDPYETNRNVVLSEPAAWNRKQLSDLVSFRNNTDLRQRIEFALELLNKELPKYNELEKKVFWNSLVGYPKGNIFYPLNLIPPTVKLFGETTFSTQRELLELASKVDDPSGREFLKRYIPIASQEFPGISFNKSMRIREQLEDNGAVRNEVIFDSPEYEKYSRSPEYVNNTLFEEEQGNLIKELTPVTKKFITISGISFKNKSEDFDGNEFLGLAYDILNGKAVPITRKAITDMVFSLLTNIEKSKISLEEVAMCSYREPG
jgi:phosphopantetheinyl transferase (holo-ACP synthase)